MIKIAENIANETTSKRILKEVLKKGEGLISGIKPVVKNIISYGDIKEEKFYKNEKDEELSKPIVVFDGNTEPMDLITHIPILCQRNEIKYFFVNDKKWIANKTCVFLKNIEVEKYNKIIKDL
ncbi:nhp2 [Ecytonucleospora hepatopenaei]|uniref:Nhp2 n=1 Tax=Ecytonucleospora hepatopenaei TaxID=646526 RepID=A0A1W0E8W8_9MICR|nr:nhp2 [Ecytonucleospora hepatopenaei]